MLQRFQISISNKGCFQNFIFIKEQKCGVIYNFHPCSPIISVVSTLWPCVLSFLTFSLFLLLHTPTASICSQYMFVSSLFPLVSGGNDRIWHREHVSQPVRIPVGLSSALWYHLAGMILKALFRVWCSGRHSVLWLFELNSGSALGWLQRSISVHEL